jgi:hypothetical protein
MLWGVRCCGGVKVVWLGVRCCGGAEVLCLALEPPGAPRHVPGSVERERGEANWC